jgi:phage/plasmid-like protein (TIGR03299 family)
MGVNDMTAAVETMAYAGAVPWHGLGTPVSNDLSVAQMLEAAGLDWTVSKKPTYYKVKKEISFGGFKTKKTEEVLTGKEALIRDSDNSFLSTVSKTWEPCQNDAAFELFEEFVDRNELEMHTAGSLKDGQIVWGLAKMKSQFVLFDNDLTEQYLLLVNPHQFGKAIHVRNTPIRVVCNNTLSLSLAQESVVSSNQSHRTEFDVEAMKETIGIATLQLDKYADMARFLGSKRFTDLTVQNYFDEVFPCQSKKKEHSRNTMMAMELLETQPGAEFGRGTWWNAFNTITYMSDHLNGKDPSKRLHSAWFGANADRKVKALDKAVVYAELSNS